MSKKRPVEERFWEKVEKLTDCWVWTAGTDDKGYGRILNKRKEHGGETRAHRLSWILHNGPIPTGLYVLHKCDNPPCVRPDHLFLGTNLDNMRDMKEKGRAANSNKEYCVNGHSNWIIKDNRRECKNCKYEYAARNRDEYNARKRERRRKGSLKT